MWPVDAAGATVVGHRWPGGREARPFGNGRAGPGRDKYAARAPARHTYLASRLTVINEAVPPGRDLPIAHRAS